MRYSKRLLLALALAPSLAFAQAPQINDVQLRPGSSTLWGAAYNVNNNQDISQYNTAGSVVDSFRWFQGASTGSAVQLWSVGPTGALVGNPTGSRQGAGTLNAQGLFVNGVAVSTSSGTPGGTPGQIQYNNAGAFGGFTTSGDATINTASGALTLATVNAGIGTFGSATSCITTTANAKGLITAISAATCTPALGSITGLTNGITNAMIRQGVARSVIGVTGNATANVADIQGSANQFLVVNSAGTDLVFAALAGDCTNLGSTLTCGQTGTWTPTIVGSSTPGTGQTYSTQAGTYQKIGREVIAHFSVVVTGLGTAAGNARIGGLPFTSTATASIFGHCIVASYSLASNTAGATGINGSIAQSLTVIDLQTSGNTGSSTITIAQAGAAFIGRGTCVYQSA